MPLPTALSANPLRPIVTQSAVAGGRRYANLPRARESASAEPSIACGGESNSSEALGAPVSRGRGAPEPARRVAPEPRCADGRRDCPAKPLCVHAQFPWRSGVLRAATPTATPGDDIGDHARPRAAGCAIGHQGALRHSLEMRLPRGTPPSRRRSRRCAGEVAKWPQSAARTALPRVDERVKSLRGSFDRRHAVSP